MSNQENIDKIMSRAKKMKGVLGRGTEEEQKSAEKKYLQYIKAHNLSDADINPEMDKRIIPVLDADYKDVLLNVILSINPYTKHSDNTNSIECYLDDEDYYDILKKYNYFSKLLRIEKELLITSFIQKHISSFNPDEKAIKKWRDRRVENPALTRKDEEAEIINKEYNRLQSDKALNIDIINKIINSDDRLVVTAFNKDRISQMQEILMNSDYKGNNTRIDK